MPHRTPSRAKAPPLLRPIPSGAVAWVGAALVLAASGFAALPCRAQLKEAPAAASVPPTKQVVSKPMWRDLSARQQRALQPLAPVWDGLNEPHKRKWLAVSRNYASLSEADQSVMHSRMTEWAALSNQERAQARLNFAEVKQVPADERKAKWEAYQALSERKAQAGRTRDASAGRGRDVPAGFAAETRPGSGRHAGRTARAADPARAAGDGAPSGRCSSPARHFQPRLRAPPSARFGRSPDPARTLAGDRSAPSAAAPVA